MNKFEQKTIKKRWDRLKEENDEESKLKYKEFQTVVNNMFVVEYDSDYIHSGDEETCILKKNKIQERMKHPDIQKQIKNGVNNLLRPQKKNAGSLKSLEKAEQTDKEIENDIYNIIDQSKQKHFTSSNKVDKSRNYFTGKHFSEINLAIQLGRKTQNKIELACRSERSNQTQSAKSNKKFFLDQKHQVIKVMDDISSEDSYRFDFEKQERNKEE